MILDERTPGEQLRAQGGAGRNVSARPRLHDWHDEATCASVGPEAFFGDDVHYRQARRLCVECPVWKECRFFGLAEEYGVWGGLAPRPRMRLRSEVGTKVASVALDTLRAKMHAAYRAAGFDIEGAVAAFPKLAAHPAMWDPEWGIPRRMLPNQGRGAAA